MSSVPRDYDSDPTRFDLVSRFSLAGDSHRTVAARLIDEKLEPVLDLGCGRGRLAERLHRRLAWIGLDTSPTQLGQCPLEPVTTGDAAHLPFRDNAFGAVTALWMLYHLEQPAGVVREARRVLRPGGLFVACTDSRHDASELVNERPPSTFDAEEAAELVAGVFDEVEAERLTYRVSN